MPIKKGQKLHIAGRDGISRNRAYEMLDAGIRDSQIIATEIGLSVRRVRDFKKSWTTLRTPVAGHSPIPSDVLPLVDSALLHFERFGSAGALLSVVRAAVDAERGLNRAMVPKHTDTLNAGLARVAELSPSLAAEIRALRKRVS